MSFSKACDRPWNVGALVPLGLVAGLAFVAGALHAAEAVIVSFHASERWDNQASASSVKGSTSGRAAAAVRRANDGYEVRLDVVARSNAFKFFSYPLAAVVVADRSGKIIDEVSAYTTAMAMGRSDEKRRWGLLRLPQEKYARVAYVFFRLKLCSWRQGFDRGNKESSGCQGNLRGGGSLWASLDREKQALARALPSAVSSFDAPVGGKFTFQGWEAARLH